MLMGNDPENFFCDQTSETHNIQHICVRRSNRIEMPPVLRNLLNYHLDDTHSVLIGLSQAQGILSMFSRLHLVTKTEMLLYHCLL